MPYLIRKASKHAADHTSKKAICFTSFIGSVVKIVLYLHFRYTKDGRLHQIKKRNMNDGKIIFLMPLLIILT